MSQPLTINVNNLDLETLRHELEQIDMLRDISGMVRVSQIEVAAWEVVRQAQEQGLLKPDEEEPNDG